MGYFSNGTEGMIYEERYCRNCYHSGKGDDDAGCPVWDAHFIYNYEQDKALKRDILSIFIPQSDDGLTNGKCAMFVDRALIQNDVATPLLPFAKE